MALILGANVVPKSGLDGDVSRIISRAFQKAINRDGPDCAVRDFRVDKSTEPHGQSKWVLQVYHDSNYENEEVEAYLEVSLLLQNLIAPTAFADPDNPLADCSVTWFVDAPKSGPSFMSGDVAFEPV